MPSFGGATIFGLAVKMKTTINPSANQLNEFFGVSGMESLFGGTRGRVTLVQGLLRGESASDLKAQEETFASYNDGMARTLTDTFNYSYANVILEAWEPTSEKVMQDTATGDYLREYRASFRHLTYS